MVRKTLVAVINMYSNWLQQNGGANIWYFTRIELWQHLSEIKWISWHLVFKLNAYKKIYNMYYTIHVCKYIIYVIYRERVSTIALLLEQMFTTVCHALTNINLFQTRNLDVFIETPSLDDCKPRLRALHLPDDSEGFRVIYAMSWSITCIY